MERIDCHYSPIDLYDRITAGLDDIGKDLSEVTPDRHTIDIGCGIGGSTRRLIWPV